MDMQTKCGPSSGFGKKQGGIGVDGDLYRVFFSKLVDYIGDDVTPFVFDIKIVEQLWFTTCTGIDMRNVNDCLLLPLSFGITPIAI